MVGGIKMPGIERQSCWQDVWLHVNGVGWQRGEGAAALSVLGRRLLFVPLRRRRRRCASFFPAIVSIYSALKLHHHQGHHSPRGHRH